MEFVQPVALDRDPGALALYLRAVIRNGVALALLLGGAACSAPESSGLDSTADLDALTPTFVVEIAPILDQHCHECHHPGGIGPFALESHEEVARRIDQIVAVIESGYMPPWKPKETSIALRGKRAVSDRELDLLRQWRDAGTPEGDSSERPQPPRWPDGWRLGEPDIVVSLDEPYSLRASGRDEVRNFVVPIPQLAGRYVSALEFDPGVRGVVHHANVLADSSGTARELDRRTEEPGYTGMVAASAPGGHFFGWTPGKTARPLEQDAAWRIEPDTDLVVQLHLQPSGKPEEVAPRVGLYFTDAAPRRRPIILHLGSTAIDLAPREGVQTFSDSYELPHDVDLHSMYPHAHYRGRHVHLRATVPQGKQLDLLRIEDWDFDWQDDYALVEPLRLPAGTTLHFEVGFDNSAENPRNPVQPPQRVLWGPESDDEMADVWLKVYPAEERDQTDLGRAAFRKDVSLSLDGLELRRELEPDSAEWIERFAIALIHLGREAEARPLLQQAVRRFREDPSLHYHLGLAHLGAGATSREATAMAKRSFERAIELEPRHDASLANLGALELLQGDLEAAAELLGRALELAPRRLEIRLNLGLAELRRRRFAEARTHLEVARELAPRDDRVLNHLGSLALQQGRSEEAERLFELAAREAPERTEALANLASLYASTGRPAMAARVLQRALERAPEDWRLAALLARAEGESGDVFSAMERLRSLLTQHPDEGSLHHDLASWLLHTGRVDDAVPVAREAWRLSAGDSDAAEQYAALLASRAELAQASRVIDSVPEERRSPTLRLLQVRVLAAIGDITRAQGIVSQLRASSPEIFEDPVAREVLESLEAPP